MSRGSSAALRLAAIAVACWAVFSGCDEEGGGGGGLLDDGLGEGDGICADYPDEPHAWSMNTVAPPSVFEGDPKDLDLESVWCDNGHVKSLIFVLGAPG